MPKWFGGSTLNPDEFIPRAQQWESQWERVLRWYQRTEEIRRKSQHTEPDAYDLDVVLAFLQNCYHLRDWIRACRPDLASKLSDLFAQHFEMSACRDVCNGFKHKSISNPSYDADFNLYREYDHFLADADSSANPVLYRIAFSDGNDVRKYDLFEFAQLCFRLWQGFIGKELESRPLR